MGRNSRHGTVGSTNEAAGTKHTDDEPAAEDDLVEPAPIELEAEAAESTSSSGLRFIVMALVVATCLAIFHLTPLKHYATDVLAWKDKIHDTGIWRRWCFWG